MKAENKTTNHNRTIKITGLPQEHHDDLTELEITTNYKTIPNDGNVVSKAIALDKIVIPAIIEALNGNKDQLVEAIRRKAAETTLISDKDYEYGPSCDDAYRDGRTDGEIGFARYLLSIIDGAAEESDLSVS